MGEIQQLRAADGFALSAYQALPSGEPKGGVVVIQEIFGVNSHIREVCEGYAQDGFAVIAPQIFDRVERDLELGYEQPDVGKGAKVAFQDLQREETLLDLQVAIDKVGVYGKVGVVGYCFGGLLTWLSACELNGVACASAYYGGGIVGEIERNADCAVMMHFGELDSHIPLSDVDKIKSALPNVEVHVYEADHGFNCDHRGSYDAKSAEIARERTIGLFERWLTS